MTALGRRSKKPGKAVVGADEPFHRAIIAGDLRVREGHSNTLIGPQQHHLPIEAGIIHRALA